jgi:hypothetical protein
MLKMKQSRVKIINIENLNTRDKYVKLWKKKYNITIDVNKEKIEDKILRFIKH